MKLVTSDYVLYPNTQASLEFQGSYGSVSHSGEVVIPVCIFYGRPM